MRSTIHEVFAGQLSTLPDPGRPWREKSAMLEHQSQAVDDHSAAKPVKLLERQEGRRTMHGLVHILPSLPLPLSSNSTSTDSSELTLGSERVDTGALNTLQCSFLLTNQPFQVIN